MAASNKQTALITGGTSGIGKELAKIFAENGYNLILVARGEEDLMSTKAQLASAYGVDITTISKDLFKHGAAKEVYEEVKASGVQVDVLVNDAGQGVYGKFWETDLDNEIDIVHLNIMSLVVLTKLYLKEMVARNDGKILQLASLVSKAPAPYQAVYAGTKAFVYNFTQGIINELQDTNVTVTALQPGATATDFFNKAGALDSKIMDQLGDPAAVAKDGYEALMIGKHKVVSGTKNKIQDVMGNFMPDEAVAENLRKQSEPKNPEDRIERK